MKPSSVLAASAVATARPWSRAMLDSIQHRGQALVPSAGATSTLESGLLGLASLALAAQYPHSPHRPRDASYLAAVLAAASTPALRDPRAAARQPLDRFSVARAIAMASSDLDAAGGNRTGLDAAASAIADSLPLQPRNPDGGLWYYVYPQWSYLDGVFSLLPYMAARGAARNESDMDLQLALLQAHCAVPNATAGRTPLVHGYDWSRTAVWADPRSGASPYVWGRSLGWFAAGLVETWELLDCHDPRAPRPPSHDRPLCARIRALANGVAASLVSLADADTGAWWQLPTLPGAPRNFLESSSTVLFVFSLLKGLRIGLLDASSAEYRAVALRAYNYTLDNFVTGVRGGNGTIGFDKTVSVCSLNSTASYDYYVSRPIVPNSMLGEAAFILASLEVERL